MTSKDRKEREREEMRELILGAASEIIAEEGIDNLSIRKIAGRIEYSPAIIYHYFSDKDDIINQQMQRGYQKIISSLSAVKFSEHPEERLKELTRSYISTALQMPDEFRAVQLSSSPAILEYTSSMFEGASVKKPALAILYQCLKDIYRDKGISDSQLELTAQVLAASSLGLVMKLILEKDIGEEQRSKLIEHYIKCMIDGMIMGKPLNEY